MLVSKVSKKNCSGQSLRCSVTWCSWNMVAAWMLGAKCTMNWLDRALGDIERVQLPSFDSCCISFWTFFVELGYGYKSPILVWHWCVVILQIWPFIRHIYWDPLATLPVGVFLDIWKLVHLSQTRCRARSAAPHKELTDLRRQLAGQWRAGISQWAASWKQQPWMENQTYHFHGQFQGSATDPPLQHLNVCAEVDHLNGREIVTELGSEKAMRR